MRGAPAPYVLGYLHGDHVTSVFHNCVAALALRDEGYPDKIIAMESGPLLCLGRNKLAAKFFDETENDWLLMVDTDMALPVDIFHRFRVWTYREGDVLSALCYSWDKMQNKAQPCAWDLEGKRFETMPGSGVIEVGMVGAACMMIHRKMLQKVRYPWFRQAVDGSVGEDTCSCQYWRSQGVRIYVDCSTVVGHVKSAIIGAPPCA